MPLKFLIVQGVLDYIETLDSGEFSADEYSFICLPPGPGEITDEEDCKENYLDEVELVAICGEVELNFKWCETLEKKIISKNRKWCLKNNSFSSDEDDLNKYQRQQT
ncbi:hypothetical protein NPIL_6661 [Nephila pilipes]|uniref:Uncharacterized protein n=1 Tax=Nephila pilipes TaxID=299642 RepID=A0A8X6U955_NEPPI|nr:hypothetical protein NPIL_6661 [Nephila pilipes]